MGERARWLAADTVTGMHTYFNKAVGGNAHEPLQVMDDGGAHEDRTHTGLDDRPGRRIHRVMDPREPQDIAIDVTALPRVPVAILAHITLPSM